ncbi:MAG: Gfo/Idh/MocA family oxidoreductase [Oscillospiraceae bacterium]|jgi:predicted dehydrogenase|nr:Gfo/Idh/MocA family oxidoreductase [Oscillospiraceae bacterium]
MISVGMMGKWHVHAPSYAAQLQTIPGARIAAVWDDDAARGAAWANELNTPFYEDTGAFLASGIDAVVCCAATTAHPQLLTQAARAGKHIFTEKLLAANTRGAEEIAAAVRESGVTFAISLPCKGDPAVRYAANLIAKGALGRVSAARFRRSHSGLSAAWLPEGWCDPALAGGGALMDLGAHPVYVLAGLFGAPIRLTAMMTNLCGSPSDENTIVLAEFASGILGTMETAFVTEGVPDLLEIYGTEGSMFARGGEITLSLRAQGGRPQAVTELPAPAPAPLAQFIAACEAGLPAPAGLGLEDALMMTRIVEAAYQAAGACHFTAC